MNGMSSGKSMTEQRVQSATIEQFVVEIMKRYTSEAETADNHTVSMKESEDVLARGCYSDYRKESEHVFAYGYHAGWLEESDLLGRHTWLDKKTAARIVHQFLKMEQKEKEEDHTSAALKLQDLYDCRSCVSHVMQVYTKGIMDGYHDHAGRYIFGMGKEVSVNEAQEIVNRIFHAKQREGRAQESAEIPHAKMITEEEALYYLRSEKNSVLIDVRTGYEFSENHLKGSRNIPLASVLKNPYMVNERRDTLLLLYCEEGYQSKIAANCLMDAGYERVLYFAWDKEEDTCTKFRKTV